MPKRKTVVEYDEIFNYAEKNHGIEWNKCCDIFHRGSILCNDGGRNKTLYLEDIKSNLKYDDDPGTTGKYPEDTRKGWEIVVEFMEANNLSEMYVDND